MSTGISQLDRIVAPALGLAVIVALAFAAQRSHPPQTGSVVRTARPLMGTVFELSVWAPTGGEPEAAEALGEALDLVATIEGRISSWDPQSETSAMNRAAVGIPTQVSPELSRLLATSLKWSQRTDGAFDVMGSALFELWNHARQTGVLPTDDEIETALSVVGHDKVRLTDEGVVLTKAGVKIGFGAIGKGYAADRVATFLRGRGFPDFIVDAGGDLVVSGTRGTQPWNVAIRHPRRDDFLAVYGATDCAIATSGDYEQFSVVGGVRQSHIVDPRTGRPARSLVSVTVVAQSGMDADALATALSVMGAEQGLKFVESLTDVECLIVEESGAVRLSTGLTLRDGNLEMIQ